MLLLDLLFFGLCFFLVLKGADYAIRFSTKLARLFNLSEFVISFFIVAIISSLPEAIISILANLEGKPEISIIALLGGNIIDLTFVFGLLAIVGNGIRVESKVMRKDIFYLVLLILPLLLGIDGTLTRTEGVVLLVSGLLFFYTLSIEKSMFQQNVQRKHYAHIVRLSLFLIVSLLVMVSAGDFTIRFLSRFAAGVGVPEFIIALFVIALGSCLPELLFSLKAVRQDHDGLALGDLLGTVIIDATIVLGIISIINPISIDPTLFRVTAFFNALSACVLIYFIRSGKVLTRVEGYVLMGMYVTFILAELLVQLT